MKKILIPIFSLCLLAMSTTISSCNSTKKDSSEKTSSPDSVAKDTVQEEIVEMPDTFTSADLKMFGLKGHVKEMTMKDDKKVKIKVRFSKEGKATILTYYDTDCKIKRNGKGQITSVGTVVGTESDKFYYALKYNASGAVVEEHEIHPSWFTDYASKYSGFNEENLPAKSSTYGGEGGQAFYDECSFTYTEMDTHGNWTTRMNKGKSWTTELEVDEEGNDKEVSSPVDRYSTTTTRVISYYSNDELKAE